MKEEKKQQQKEEGYISFDPEELKNATQEGDPNDEAYELFENKRDGVIKVAVECWQSFLLDRKYGIIYSRGEKYERICI